MYTLPSPTQVGSPWTGFHTRNDTAVGIPESTLASCFATLNTNSQVANGGTAGRKEVYSFLRGDTNTRISATATNHGNILHFANPLGFKYLELYHAYRCAAAVTCDTAPKVVVMGRARDPQVGRDLLPATIDPTNYPDGTTSDKINQRASGLWLPCTVPGYTAGTPEVTLADNRAVIEGIDPAAGTTYSQIFVMTEPLVVYIGGISSGMVLVHTAAVFSAAATSLILGRLTTN